MKKMIRDGYFDRDFWKEAARAGKAIVCDSNDLAKDYLIMKVAEELRELEETGYKSVEEWGDVVDAMQALMERNGIRLAEVLESSAHKTAELGGFDKGLVLEMDVTEESKPTHWPGRLVPTHPQVYQVHARDIRDIAFGAGKTKTLWRKHASALWTAKCLAEEHYGRRIEWNKKEGYVYSGDLGHVDYTITTLTIR